MVRSVLARMKPQFCEEILQWSPFQDCCMGLFQSDKICAEVKLNGKIRKIRKVKGTSIERKGEWKSKYVTTQEDK